MSGPGFCRISDGIADLADVVEERPELESLQRVPVELERTTDEQRHVGDPARM